jgi:hypothetical protein
MAFAETITLDSATMRLRTLRKDCTLVVIPCKFVGNTFGKLSLRLSGRAPMTFLLRLPTGVNTTPKLVLNFLSRFTSVSFVVFKSRGTVGICILVLPPKVANLFLLRKKEKLFGLNAVKKPNKVSSSASSRTAPVPPKKVCVRNGWGRLRTPDPKD